MNHVIHPINQEETWCKQPINFIDFIFKTLDQVAINGLFNNEKIPCKECINNSVNALTNNIEVHNE